MGSRQPFTRREFPSGSFARNRRRNYQINRAANPSGRPGDFFVHWGGNWGYDVPEEQIRFARKLIDSGAVDVVHGHSSHHVRPLEVYRGKLILYGAGDFLNDYEGIEGNEGYRDDLTLMYFPTFDLRTGRLVRLRMVPLQIFRFSLRRASVADATWLSNNLNRESSQFGTRVRSRKWSPRDRA